jgi:hypothetical protein
MQTRNSAFTVTSKPIFLQIRNQETSRRKMQGIHETELYSPNYANQPLEAICIVIGPNKRSN